MSNFWTSLPSFSGRNKTDRLFAQRLMMAACVVALSACGQGSTFGGSRNAQPTSTADGQTSIALPPEMSKPLLPGQSGGEYTPDGLPALQPARGVNIENLFAENIKDPVERVKRVENAVIELRRDFNAVMPAVIRLSAVEADMQELLRQLEDLLRSEPPAANQNPYTPEGAPQPLSISAASPSPSVTAQAAVTSPQTPPAPAQPATAPQAAPQPIPQPIPQAAPQPSLSPVTAAPAQSPPPQNSGAAKVTGLRLGEHPGKTRLVMDITGRAPYRYDLDNAENLLVVELPGTDWGAASQDAALKSPMVQSYSVQPMDGGGSRVIIQLKRNAQVGYEALLPPENGGAHRLVIDLQG